MADDTATLVLKGKVSLSNFATAVQGFTDLLNALASDVAKGAHIDWQLAVLEAASAHTTVKGVTLDGWDPALVPKVVHAYRDVGNALRAKRPIPYSPEVRASALRIVGVMNGEIRSVVFETADDDVEVFSPGHEPEPVKAAPRLTQIAHGSIRGRVQSLSNRHELRFTLYDLVHDNPVSCYLQEGSEDLMRASWGRMAIVEGVVRRDPFTGHPTTIRQITKVYVIPESKGSWRDAIGAAKGKPGGMLPEEAIRRVRDG